MKRPPLSPTSLRRFPKYRAVAQALVDQGWDYITSGDIARACGFANAQHFSNAFRAAYGLTPSQARAQS